MGLFETSVEKKDFSVDDLPNNVLKDIYRYWQEMKGSRNMPSRADLNPADIVSLLPHIVLVDVEPDTGRYKYRLIGTETVKVMGFDVTGKYLNQYPAIEESLKGRYDWLVKEKTPYLYFNRLKWTEKDFLEYYALGLPLSNNGQDVNILMFGMYYQFPKGKGSEFFTY